MEKSNNKKKLNFQKISNYKLYFLRFLFYYIILLSNKDN